MAKFVIREVWEDQIYIVVTRDDGTSFGKILRDIDGVSVQDLLDDIARRAAKAISVGPPSYRDMRVLDAHTGREIIIQT